MTRSLCAGERRANSVAFSAASASSAIGHFLHVAPEKHGIGRKAHVLAYLAADELVVSGEDFHRHAVL